MGVLKFGEEPISCPLLANGIKRSETIKAATKPLPLLIVKDNRNNEIIVSILILVIKKINKIENKQKIKQLIVDEIQVGLTA